MNGWLTLLCASAALLGTRWNAGAPALSLLPWLVLAPWLWWSVQRARRPGAAPPTAAVWLGLATMAGFAMTMWSLAMAYTPSSAPPSSLWRHQPFGEHVVLVHAGLPWPGVEGSGHALARDCIPFDMGVDALLCNFACWSLLAWWGLRRLPRAHLPEIVWLSGVAAATGALFGGMRLMLYFD